MSYSGTVFSVRSTDAAMFRRRPSIGDCRGCLWAIWEERAIRELVQDQLDQFEEDEEDDADVDEGEASEEHLED